MTVKRIAIQAAVTNLTAGKGITVDANGLLIDSAIALSTAAAARLSLAVVDANDRMPAAMMPTKVLNSYWHASNDEKTVVQGTWVNVADPNQTDYDPALVNSGYHLTNNTTHNNLDEIHFGSLTFTRGTYKVSFSTYKNIARGILEILHGTTSIGTYDCYNATDVNNVTSSFTYSPATTVTGNLRFRVNGKNAAVGAGNYYIWISRIEIIRTG